MTSFPEVLETDARRYFREKATQTGIIWPAEADVHIVIDKETARWIREGGECNGGKMWLEFDE